MLYHYTDYIALDGILSQTELRLNNVLNMNDASEMNLFMHSLCQSVSALFEKEGNREKELLTRILFAEEQEKRFQYSSYAACFSRYRDDAAQWERYGNQGMGICIGFDEEILSKMADGVPSMRSVLYKENIPGHHLTNEIHEIIDSISVTDIQTMRETDTLILPEAVTRPMAEASPEPIPQADASPMAQKSPEPMPQADTRLMSKASPELIPQAGARPMPEKLRDALNRAWEISAIYKHPSFASENEVRLLISPFGQGYIDVQPRYHISRERIKKYYPLNLDEMCRKASVSLEDLILELIIGPESTQSLPILQDYLHSLGLHRLAKQVSYSKCPLRRRIL